MDNQSHKLLLAFLTDIENSKELRDKFISNPMGTIAESLQIQNSLENNQITLSNKLMLSALSNPEVISALSDLDKNQKDGKISEDEKTLETARALLSAAPDEVKEQIHQIWGQDELTLEKLKNQGPTALANLWVAANETAVVNHFVVHNTEYVTSGLTNLKKIELTKIANIITKSN